MVYFGILDFHWSISLSLKMLKKINSHLHRLFKGLLLGSSFNSFATFPCSSKFPRFLNWSQLNRFIDIYIFAVTSIVIQPWTIWRNWSGTWKTNTLMKRNRKRWKPPIAVSIQRRNLLNMVIEINWASFLENKIQRLLLFNFYW